MNATSPTIKNKLVIKFSDTIATKYTHPEATKYTSVADNYHWLYANGILVHTITVGK